MDALGGKDDFIRGLVAAVSRRVPQTDLLVVDWWPADPCAISLARRSNPGRLAFVSRPPEFRGEYLLSCEFAARQDVAPVHNIEADPFGNDLDALANVIATHLGAA